MQPKVSHPKSKKNNIGLKRRDYEGVVSTLCAGCGHDSITAALIQAVYEFSKSEDIQSFIPISKSLITDWQRICEILYHVIISKHNCF